MNQLFNISRIDAVRVKEIEEAPDEPHVHDFEELIVGIKGSLEHFLAEPTKTRGETRRPDFLTQVKSTVRTGG